MCLILEAHWERRISHPSARACDIFAGCDDGSKPSLRVRVLKERGPIERYLLDSVRS
jgi:hypothetical protein